MFMEGFVKSKTVAALRAITFIICFALCGALSTGCVSHVKQVEKVRAAIPEAIKFIESNVEFLDMLLDIKDRIKMFNENSSNTPDSDETLVIDSITFEIYKGGLDVIVYFEEANTRGRIGIIGSRFDILTFSEMDTIESKLLELLSYGHTSGMVMSADEISISYTEYRRAFLLIENPALEFEIGNSVTYTYYESSEQITDEWCIRICKLNYN